MKPDACHCTVQMAPAGVSVHIYVNLGPKVPITSLEVTGETGFPQTATSKQ